MVEDVRIMEGDSRRYVLGILELAYAVLKTGDSLLEDLRARLAFAIVVLTAVALLCPYALLASRLGTIAPLTANGLSSSISGPVAGITHHFSLPMVRLARCCERI